MCPVSVQAACSRLQCLCLYYSILQHLTASYSLLQRHRTCAFSPPALLGDSEVPDLSIPVHLQHRHPFICICIFISIVTAVCTPRQVNPTLHLHIPRRISIKPSRRSSYQMLRAYRRCARFGQWLHVCVHVDACSSFPVTTIICTIVFPDSPCISGLASRC